jgi:hypothetical protein
VKEHTASKLAGYTGEMIRGRRVGNLDFTRMRRSIASSRK